MSHRLSLAAILALAIGVIAAMPAASSAHPGAHLPEGDNHGNKRDLQRARAATRKYRNVRVARAAGTPRPVSARRIPSTAAWASTTPTRSWSPTASST